MSTIVEIENAIRGLTPAEREELYAWFDEQFPKAVDAAIESDLAAGRFDSRIARAVADHRTGNTRPL